MRRPGVRFWRVVFAASVILFVAGAAVTVMAGRQATHVRLSSTTGLYFGGRLVTLHWKNPRLPIPEKRSSWMSALNRRLKQDALSRFDWWPTHDWDGNFGRTMVPSKYFWVPPLLSASGAVFMIRRHKKRNAAGLCAGCGYSLAGLPTDATACPECGGKIGKSAAEAR